MGINIRDTASIAKKFAANAGRAGADYTDGVKNPKRNQAEAAAASAPAWEEGVKRAAEKGRFKSGVEAAGDEKWKRKTTTVGPRRFEEGAKEAQADFQKGAEPYLAALRGIELGPRFPKGDPRNLDRVKVVAAKMRETRVGAEG